ncbi:toxin-antitoxin system YwqK family antitoxin [Bacteroidota bacterium]
MKLKVLVVYFILLSYSVYPQDTKNRIDDNGLKQGYWEKRYPNGHLMYKGIFKDNEPVGEFIRYFENGEIKAKMSYEGNNYVYTMFFAQNGKLSAEGYYLNKEKEGVWVFYNDLNDSISAHIKYVMGKKDGKTYRYYENGKILEEKTYNNDTLDGVWRKYFENGQVMTEVMYNQGKLNGPFNAYFLNGRLEITGFYKKGVRDGTWKHYDNYGKLINKIEYRDGQPINKEELELESTKELEELERKSQQYLEPEKEFMNEYYK